MEDLVIMSHPDRIFWQGKRVLVTGHSGFKGSWLVLWLQRLGAVVAGLSLPPATTPSLFTLAGIDTLCESYFGNILDAAALNQLAQALQPEIVFHLAAQPLVLESYNQPVETFATNVMGSVHVLEALRGLDSVRAVVMITTDKVYHNREWAYPYRETDALGGHDPYSASKAASEIVIASYRDAFLAEQGVAVASARAGNVIGGGDWAADRIIPDAVRAWQRGQTLQVRRPDAIRPWQHVLEPLSGYLRLAEQLWRQPDKAGAYNFGLQTHEAATVREVVEQARVAYGAGDVAYGQVETGPHEAGWLALEISKARTELGYRPRWGLDESIRRTMRWYAAQADGMEAQALCAADIDAFEAAV